MRFMGSLEKPDAPSLGRSANHFSKVTNRDCWAWAGWEPDRFYRRLGRNSTFYFGNGTWLADWRKRLQSPENLYQLQEIGVTLLVTRFFKGFGPKTEAKEWEEAVEFVRQAQKLGLKVWGYQQGGSLFGETLFLERPEARSWIAKTWEGRELTWGPSYFRFMPCLNNPEYQVFFQDILEQGICTLEFDGIHIDNNYYPGCYCDRCCKLFRDWLNQRPDLELVTGLPDAGAVFPPNLESPDSLIADPVRILWIAFNVETRHRFYRKMYRHLKSLRAGAQLCANPAYPRNLSSRRNLSLDPSIEAEICDFLFAENGNQPGWEKRMTSQAEAHLLADAGGYRTVSTSWRHVPDAWRQGEPASNPPRASADIWTGLAEEFSHSRAMLGNNWMMRSSGNHDQMLADTMPEHMEAFRQAMSFFRDLETQVELPERRAWGEYGVLLNPVSLSLCGQATGEVSRAVIRYLQLRRLPFRVLFSADDVPPEMHHLIACHQLCLPDTEMAALLAFAQAPQRSLTLLGDSGRYNEWGVPRNETDWRTLFDQPGVRQFRLPLPSGAEVAGAHLASGISRINCNLKTALDSAFQGSHRRVRAAYQLLLNIESGTDGRLFIHLRDQSGKMREILGAGVFVGDVLPDHAELRAFLPAASRKDCLETTIPVRAGWVWLPPFEQYCLLTAGNKG